MEQLKLALGEVNDGYGLLRIELCVRDGVGTVHVFSCDDKTHHRAGYLMLDAWRWAELKNLIAKADSTIEKLKAAGATEVHGGWLPPCWRSLIAPTTAKLARPPSLPRRKKNSPKVSQIVSFRLI